MITRLRQGLPCRSSFSPVHVFFPAVWLFFSFGATASFTPPAAGKAASTSPGPARPSSSR